MSTVPLIPDPSIVVADGEWKRSASKEGLWVAIDLMGTKRNITTAIGTGCEIAGTSAKVASVCAGGIVPVFFMVGGAMIVGSAIFHTLPDAYHEYKSAKAEQALEMALFRDPNTRTNAKGLEYADEGLRVAKLGIANQSLYTAMGSAQVAAGVTTMMSPIGADLFGFTPVVSTTVASAAGAALGAVYLVRGTVVLARAMYNLSYLNEFQQGFREALKTEGASPEETADAAIAFVQEIRSDSSALKRRIGELGEDVPKINEHSSLEDKIAYLEAVDKGIHTKKLQQKVSIFIGLAMFFGGLAAIAAIILSGGLAIPIIALVSAICFTAMEGVFACYDSSWAFEKLRHYCYTPSDEIQKLRAQFEAQKAEESRMEEIAAAKLSA